MTYFIFSEKTLAYSLFFFFFLCPSSSELEALDGSRLSDMTGMDWRGPAGLTWSSADILIFCLLLAQTRAMSSVTLVLVSSLSPATSFSTNPTQRRTSSCSDISVNCQSTPEPGATFNF